MKSAILLILFLPASQMQAHVLQQVDTLSDKNVVQDTVVITKVLKTVKTHILSVTKDRKRPLVVKEGKKSRRFIVREFLGKVSWNKNVYTAELDTDEYDHLIPRILYVDVKRIKGAYRVTRIRIGPNRFRDKEMQR